MGDHRAGRLKQNVIVEPTSRLDMATTLIVDYAAGGPSPLGAIRAMLTSDYAGGAWSGNGISVETSDPGRGVGYAESSALFTQFPATFSYYHHQIDDTTVILHATRHGDANLDGQVNLQDFNRGRTAYGAVREGVLKTFGTGMATSKKCSFSAYRKNDPLVAATAHEGR